MADQQTKEKILAEQRNWIAMKDEVTLLNLGSVEENGSMYPLLVNSFLEEITKHRVYVLANELAKIKGETEGTFVDNGNGELAFVSDDGSVKGIIKINGWDGASFEVTETTGESVFNVGETFKFPFMF